MGFGSACHCCICSLGWTVLNSFERLVRVVSCFQMIHTSPLNRFDDLLTFHEIFSRNFVDCMLADFECECYTSFRPATLRFFVLSGWAGGILYLNLPWARGSCPKDDQMRPCSATHSFAYFQGHRQNRLACLTGQISVHLINLSHCAYYLDATTVTSMVQATGPPQPSIYQ